VMLRRTAASTAGRSIGDPHGQASQTTLWCAGDESGWNLGAALAAAVLYNTATCFGRHALAEAVALGATAYVWLESSLHNDVPMRDSCRGRQRGGGSDRTGWRL